MSRLDAIDTSTVQREWLRTGEASRLVGLGRTKLWELSAQGAIKTAKVGRAVRYERQSLLDYMERMSQNREEAAM